METPNGITKAHLDAAESKLTAANKRIEELTAQVEKINKRHVRADLDRTLDTYGLSAGVRGLLIGGEVDRFEFDADGKPLYFNKEGGGKVLLTDSDGLLPVVSHFKDKYPDVFSESGEAAASGSDKAPTLLDGKNPGTMSDAELAQFAQRF